MVEDGKARTSSPTGLPQVRSPTRARFGPKQGSRAFTTTSAADAVTRVVMKAIFPSRRASASGQKCFTSTGTALRRYWNITSEGPLSARSRFSSSSAVSSWPPSL